MHVFIDGASRGNPGPAAAGVVFKDLKGKTVKSISLNLGVTTNNVAEYCALVIALQEAVRLRFQALLIFTDSELLTKQFSGEYRIKDPVLRILNIFVQHLRQGFRKLEIRHIGREQNKLADEAANRALDRSEFFL